MLCIAVTTSALLSWMEAAWQTHLDTNVQPQPPSKQAGNPSLHFVQPEVPGLLLI